jgi:PIN domain nuclease of toxin-antitoxin system
VAEIDGAATDTHALLYFAGARSRLGARAAEHFARAEQRKAIVYVPAAVIWEVCLLARAGRFNLRRPPRAFFDDLFSNPAYQPYDLTAAQIVDADELRINKDPFDALICAAARQLGLPLITRDVDIELSGAVRVLW